MGKPTHQFVDGKPHLLRKKACEDIPKIPGGGDDSDTISYLERWRGSGKRKVGVEIVRCLRQNTRPVDGIDSTEFQSLIRIRIIEQSLDDVLVILLDDVLGNDLGAYLTIIKCTL
jgi:hypothetical protein